MTKKFNQGELTGFNCEPEEVVQEINVKHKMVNEFSTTEISLRISNCKFFQYTFVKEKADDLHLLEENDLTAEGNMNNLNQISDVALKAVN